MKTFTSTYDWSAWANATHYQIDDGPWIELAKPRPLYTGRHRA